MVKRVAFFGTPDFAVPSLKTVATHPNITVPVVVTQPDANHGRGQTKMPPPIKAYAVRAGIPVIQPARIKRDIEAVIGKLDETGPYDGAIVAAFGQILPKRLLAYFNNRCINVHASLLPRFRGAAPIQRAIIAGDAVSGVCLMQMEEGLDSGPVFIGHEVPLTNTITGEELHDLLASYGAYLLDNHILAILNGDYPSTPQDNEYATFAPKIDKTECSINWKNSAQCIERLIRAFSPFPGTYTTLDGVRLKIGKAAISQQHQDHLNVPGTILTSAPHGAEVACGEGVIILEHVQRPGKRMMTWDDFIRGSQVEIGTVLGL